WILLRRLPPKLRSSIRPGRDYREHVNMSQVAISSQGDVWQRGDHRLFCGDATQADQVSGLLQAAPLVLMITDPPYGVSYDPKWREEAGLGSQRQTGLVQNED